MAAHFEIKEVPIVSKLIKSQIWVGNQALIDFIVDRIVFHGKRRHPISVTDEFWATVLRDGSKFELSIPKINKENLQLLVDSKIWENRPKILSFILNEYIKLSRDDRANFCSQEFWEAIFGETLSQKGAGRPITDFYEIGEQSRLRVKLFGSEAIGYNIRFHNTDQIDHRRMGEIFDDIIRQLLVNRRPQDRVGFEIIHPSLNPPTVYIPFTTVEATNSDRVLSVIENINQSKKDFKFDQDFQTKVVIVENPTGAGKSRYERTTSRLANWDDWFKRHTGHGSCFLQIQNSDNLCLARALVVAKSKFENHTDRRKKRIADSSNNLQGNLAKKLQRDVGLENINRACSLDEVQQFQDFLAPEYQIKIYSKDHYNGLIYKGPEAQKILYLYLHDHHFDVITRVPAFLGKSYYCNHCDRGYSNEEDHHCIKQGCLGCLSANPCAFERWVHCSDCNRYLPSQACYENHRNGATKKGNKQQKVYSTCNKLKRCKTCNQLVRTRHSKQHNCNQFFCKTCNQMVDKEGHECFMKVITDEKKQKKPPKFIFFDFETRQDQEIEPNNLGAVYKHIPNLCIAYRRCDTCRNKPLGTCAYCGVNRHEFLGDNCLQKFGNWLFSQENRGAIALAHNARGFDSQFILEYLHEQKTVPPKIVTRGLEILMLEAGGIRIIDTLNYLPMPLLAFPKTFGFTELKKGHFPHLFNRKENWDYEGPLPDKEFYSPDTLKEEARAEFLDWYKKEKAAGKAFKFREELVSYCESDVDILSRCALKFRDIFLEETGVDPFVTSLTIASACNYVFRKKYLQENTIGLIPHGGYSRAENQSVIAIKWLKYTAETRKINIRHKLNGGEVKIGPYKVDGIHEKEIFEFYGCHWHGCPTCIPKRFHTIADGRKAEEAFQATIERKKFLENQGYSLTEKWECQLRKELKENKDLAEYFNKIEIPEPLGPRDAFYGGRTNAIRLYHHCEVGEQIKYVDVCSLYPWVCKTGEFPTGHPQIITENFQDLSTKPYNGIIKATVIPPRKLFHPVLPYRHSGKLLFPLCRTCADTESESCQHRDSERAINGAWVSLELYKAMDLGYKILKVQEVWHYKKTTRYDPKTKEGGLFAEYINTFLRHKQQADGWPSWVKTDEDKEKYIHDYEEKEGIKLDPTKIDKIPGMRALAKLMLNSFWGEFGQRNDLSQMQYFTKPDEFYKILFDSTYEVSSVRFFGEALACVTYKVDNQYQQNLQNTNSVIASYVTAQARLKLYSYLEKLLDRVLYFDTDSIIYLSREGDYEVPTGSFLGQMTDELKAFGEGAYIKEFVAGGPKNYGYRVTNNTGEIVNETNKIRGFSLNFQNKQTLTFNNLKRMVQEFALDHISSVETILEKRILRDHERNILTKTVKKDYHIIYTKRYLTDNFKTLPYGF